MFSIPFCGSIGIHVLLVFGITELALPGDSMPANETCANVSGQNICYFKGSEKLLTWNEAWLLCNSLNSTMPVIRSRNDQDVLEGYLKSYRPTIIDSAAWTAGKNITLSIWTWVNGESLKESDQVQLQQEGEQNEKVYAALEIDSTLTTLAAYNDLPYICQYEGTYCNSASDVTVNDKNKCLRLNNDSRSWYDARNQCLMSNGDLAVIGDKELGLLRNLALNQTHWIGLRKKSWRWFRNNNAESNDEIRFTNWDINVFSMSGECISIDASDGKWKAVGCVQPKEVVCQTAVLQESTTHGSQVSMPQSSAVSEESTTYGSFVSIPRDLPGLEGSPPILLLAVVVPVIVIIICIICIIVVVVVMLRKRKRSGYYDFRIIGDSQFNSRTSLNHGEELDSRITKAPFDTFINDPENAPVKDSDDIRGVDVEIPFSTFKPSQDEATDQQPGIACVSLEGQKEPTYLETDEKSADTTAPSNIDILRDVCAMPGGEGHEVTAPGNAPDGSDSHPNKVTEQEDAYAHPMKTSKSSAVSRPREVLYANLQTEMLGNEQEAEEHAPTK